MKPLLLSLLFALALGSARADDGARTEAACRAAFQSLKPGMGGMAIQLRGDGADYTLLSGNQTRTGTPGQTLLLPFGQSVAFLGKKQNIRFTPLPGQLGSVGFYVESGLSFGNLGNGPAADHGIVLAQPGTSVRFVAPDMGKAAAALKMPKAN